MTAVSRTSSKPSETESAFAISWGDWIAVCAVLLWIWLGFCTFPLHGWNAVRLAPSFMFDAGVTPYPGMNDGPVTTWIYGPVTILWLLPATFARSTTSALLLADLLNLLLAAIPLVVALRVEHHRRRLSGRLLIQAALLWVALWPTSNLHFLQADNAAIALGIISNCVLVSVTRANRWQLWSSALLTAGALWSKQTELGLAVGQILFCFVRGGLRAGTEQLVRFCVCAALCGCVFLRMFDPAGLWFNMFVLPSHLPLAPLLPKILSAPYWGPVAGYVVLPCLCLVGLGRRILTRDSNWLLPGAVFVCSLPFNFLAFASVGGSSNSLHGAVYLIPAASVAIAAGLPSKKPISLGAVLVMITLAFQFSMLRTFRFTPAVLPLQQGQVLAEELRHHIYFPWNPLLTYFSDGRFYHVEDGLTTRSAAGAAASRAQIFQHLPQHINAIAYHKFTYDGPIVQLIPAHAREDQFGEWVMYSWSSKIDH